MAKEMKRVLREKQLLTPKQAKFLTETTVQFSKEAWLRQALLRLPWRIHQERWSFRELNDMLLEVLQRASYAEDGQIVHLDSYDPRTNLQSDSQKYAPLETSHYDMDKEPRLDSRSTWNLSGESLYFWAR